MIFALLLLACAPEPADTEVGCDTGPEVDWHSFGAGFFTTYCRSCHSSEAADRHEAPAGVDFDSEAEVRALAGRVRARVLDVGDMPVGGGVYPEDLLLLDLYLRCGL